MSKFWRVVAPVVAAGGLVAAGAVPAASASPAATSITISATSPHFPGASNGKVDGYALVVFRAGGGLNTATISGTVATSNTGDTATLMAKPFGKSAYAAVGAPISLTPVSGSAPYSFSVKPSLATSYEVTVAGTDSATSSAVSVYVTEGGKGADLRSHCSAGHCTTSWKAFTILPAAAYKFEVGKKWYLYMTISKSLPRYLHLTKSGSASKARKVNANEYEVTLTFHYSAPTPKYFWGGACTKDTESKDGLGLPGHHGCGNLRVSIFSTYLG
ncbi:MAG TPA: hypothetical protein VGH96_20735 [Streptosporangiaceae bacterium]|jgi:hypothetical protein